MHTRTIRLSRLLPVLALAASPVTGFAEPGIPALTNPQVSLILDGVAYTDDIDGAGNEWLEEAAGISHAHGHGDEHGGIEEGVNLREAELVLSASVDTWFDGYANLAFSEDGVELEEAYFTTRSLPAGWQLKAGKFLSGFGYANAQHPHARDFVDQNLAWLSLIGDHGLNDKGAQVTWLAPTGNFLQLGAEVLQGDGEKFGTRLDLDDFAADLLDELGVGTGDPEADGLPPVDARGPQLFAGFVRFAPDLGTDQELLLGASFARHTAQQEMHEEGDPVTDMFYADGEATLAGLQATWKRTATGRYGQGALRVSAEYLRLEKDLDILWHTTATEIGEPLTGEQDGWYLQGVWGFAPRWEAGLRVDATGGRNEFTEGGVTTRLDESRRNSLALTFRPSEFSALRLQLSDADITDESGANENFTQFMLQYSLSLGAHGAHNF
jgi:hypothetical protein